jgi:hypothetical protein
MGCCVLIDPVRFFIGHPMAANNLSSGTRPVDRAGQRSIAKRFGPVSPLAGVPVVNEAIDRLRWHHRFLNGLREILRRSRLLA